MRREEASAAAFTLDVREDARVIRREQAAGAGEARRIDLGAARGLRPPLSWLGGVYDGRALRSIEAVDLGPGFAYRLRYGQITVWNYTNVVPPEVLGARRGQAKPVPIENEIASFYATADGVLVAELERPGRSVAVVAPELAKVDVIDVLEQLRPLR